MPAAIPSSSSASQDLAGLPRGGRGKGVGSSTSTSAAEAAAAAEFAAKKYVWIPEKDVGYRSAWVVSEDQAKDTCLVSLDDGTQRTVPTGDISRQNPPRFELSENIADLTFLSEAGVSHCLRQRYQRGLIYTYSGLFLVAVNPYHQLPIYTDSVVAAYKGRRREENAPHVFAVADEAMRNMLDNRENQSLLITGESGAGKTENTKKVIQYLAAVAADMAAGPQPGGSGAAGNASAGPSSSGSVLGALTRSGSSRYVMDRLEGVEAVGSKRLGLLERQILQANPILEAFGNAQTIRNNNSSRFGKFVRIEFTSVGAIAGANIDWYLLEKSRVHKRSDNERSFHVFYQLLRSGDRALLEKLLLTGNPGDYHYLKTSRQNVEGMDDGAEWQTLKSALDTVGFKSDEQLNFFRVVAAILQVGNIELADDRSEQARINNAAQVEKVCHLLGVPEQELRKALVRPRVKAGREWVTQSRTRRQVIEEMAALCKTMYEKTFASIVERINQALDRPTSKSTFIGVLDIAGFEIFEHNSFEQLCINYTNEKLQQFFNHHMFVLEQEEYARENIEWDFVNFGLDLQPTIDLIESTSPIGILSCLDEECIMPKATDETFTEKCNRIWATNKDGSAKDTAGAAAAAERGVAHGSTKYVAARFATGFTIRHYAGNVEYRTDGWLDKNKDPLNDNLTRVMAESTDRFIASLFSEFLPEDEFAAAPNGAAVASPAKRRPKRGAFRTLAQKHKEQLTSLMNQLGSTQPHFVRCIVPNAQRKPGKMDLPLVLEQLRCNGVLEGIRIARLGYPNRLLFNEFRNRYEVLTPDIIPRGYMDGRKACQRMVEALALDTDVFKIGLTKVFFKAGVLAELEERRDALLFDIFSRFQAGCRMFTARRQMKKILNRAAAVRTIQRNARLYVELRDWPWWQLYSRVRPLLKATRHDEELKRKELELALATERAERDQKEREALAALKGSLETEKKRVEEELSAERALLADKDAQLTRSREREAALEEDLAAMQKDVDQLDDQLERAMAGQKAAEAARVELQAAFDQAADHLLRLEAAEKDWKSREAVMTSDLGSHTENHAKLTAERDALVATRAELERKVKASSEDLDRHQKRLNARVAELEARVAEEQQGRSAEQGQAAKLQEQVRKLEYELSEAGRTSTATQGLVKEHEARVAHLEKQLADTKAQHDAALRQHSDGKAKLEAELATAKAEVEQGQKARTALQRELDETRRVIEAKSSEDVKQREVQRMKEDELANLRKQMASAQEEHAAAKQRALEQAGALQSQLEVVKKQHAEATAAHRDASTKLDDHVKKSGEAAAALAAAQQAHRATQGELDGHKQRADAAESSLAALKKAKADLDAALSTANAELQDHEDALIECERSRSAWQSQAEETSTLLEAEQQARLSAEQALRRERSNTQQQLTAKDQELQKLKNELALLSGDLRKAQSMTGKTTIEHVHVFAEAKRKTDSELSEIKADLEKQSRINASLEKIKMRLMAENEDLVRENARLTRGAGATGAQGAMTTHDVGSTNGSTASSSNATALRQAQRDRDEAQSRERRALLSLETLREQSEARIIELERQLETSHLAHTNTFTNLHDIVKQEEEKRANDAAPRPASPFKRKLLEELSNGHRALEADIAAKSKMLKGATARVVVNSPRRSNGSAGGSGMADSSWVHNSSTPTSMKRTSTDVGGVVARNATEEAQRLQRQVKELAIDVSSLKQNAADAEGRARHWQREAERAQQELMRAREGGGGAGAGVGRGGGGAGAGYAPSPKTAPGAGVGRMAVR